MANNREETERRFEVIRLARKYLTSIELTLMDQEPSTEVIDGHASNVVRLLVAEFGPKE